MCSKDVAWHLSKLGINGGNNYRNNLTVSDTRLKVCNPSHGLPWPSREILIKVCRCVPPSLQLCRSECDKNFTIKTQSMQIPLDYGFLTNFLQGNGHRPDTFAQGSALRPGALIIKVAKALKAIQEVQATRAKRERAFCKTRMKKQRQRLEDARFVAEQFRLLLLLLLLQPASRVLRVHEEENELLLVNREELENLSARALRNNSRRKRNFIVGLGQEGMDTDKKALAQVGADDTT